MSEIVEGKPVRVAGRELVPVVRVEKVVRRRAFVGAGGLTGEGVGFVHMRPVAVLERQSGAAARRIPISDVMARLIGGLFLAALIIPLLMMVAVHVARACVTRED
jgi:hypothetical protein